MGDGWSRKQRRELRKLQGLAWERELNDALQLLQEDFEAWRKGEITPLELSHRIHEFHDGRSRELDNTYSGSLNGFPIELVVARGIIDESELSDDLLGVLKDHIDHWRERLQAADQSAGRK